MLLRCCIKDMDTMAALIIERHPGMQRTSFSNDYQRSASYLCIFVKYFDRYAAWVFHLLTVDCSCLEYVYYSLRPLELQVCI